MSIHRVLTLFEHQVPGTDNLSYATTLIYLSQHFVGTRSLSFLLRLCSTLYNKSVYIPKTAIDPYLLINRRYSTENEPRHKSSPLLNSSSRSNQSSHFIDNFRNYQLLMNQCHWKRDVAINTFNLKGSRRTIYVPLAMSTNHLMKIPNVQKKTKRNLLGSCWAEISVTKTQPMFSSRRSSTDIDLQNQRLRHEIFTGRAR